MTVNFGPILACGKLHLELALVNDSHTHTISVNHTLYSGHGIFYCKSSHKDIYPTQCIHVCIPAWGLSDIPTFSLAPFSTSPLRQLVQLCDFFWTAWCHRWSLSELFVQLQHHYRLCIHHGTLRLLQDPPPNSKGGYLHKLTHRWRSLGLKVCTHTTNYTLGFTRHVVRVL